MIKVSGVVAVLTMLVGAATAQPTVQSVTIDPQLWGEMTQAIGQVAMPLSAHQQVQQIIASVQREAQARAERAKAPPPPPPPAK